MPNDIGKPSPMDGTEQNRKVRLLPELSMVGVRATQYVLSHEFNM